MNEACFSLRPLRALRTSVLLPAGAAAVCLLSPLSGIARAQTADLPAAPSAVLAKQIQQEQEEAHSRVAGSNFKFTAPKTIPGPGGEAIELPTDTPLPISLDDAIALGLERNVRLRYDRAKQKMVHGEELGVINALLPGLRAMALTSTQEINLAAMGFKPQSLGPVLSQFGIAPSAFKTIVKVNVTQAVVSANQELFDLPAYELYRGARREAQVVDLDVLNSRGDLVYSVGAAYLRVLADQSSLINAQAQERASRMLFDQATERKNAGIGINLDVLRGQVAYQQHQQARIAAEAQLAKDTIQLNRIMGLPAGQKLELTDTAPFTDLVGMDLDRAKATAYLHRKDLLSLQGQIDVADRELRAVRYQRLPVLAFNGFYGVIGETTGLYHGVFAATGTLKFPIFREAEQRGQEEQIHAQLTALKQQESDLRVAIDAQIRAAMLDVQAAQKLVNVAQSNVELAQQELSDERDRFAAGVEDNLAVVDAQASVTQAQAQLVSALYQYNVAKLTLARNSGVVESRYRAYLGK